MQKNCREHAHLFTGLGLSIAHGIIAEQGGTIDVKSEEGKGTSFVITLQAD
ncbi:MAG: hypothetical protein HY808_02955 [Nitrospirae bacterium]|nr:hypothetical protein [Nitrospirota bacterium]